MFVGECFCVYVGSSGTSGGYSVRSQYWLFIGGGNGSLSKNYKFKRRSGHKFPSSGSDK